MARVVLNGGSLTLLLSVFAGKAVSETPFLTRNSPRFLKESKTEVCDQGNLAKFVEPGVRVRIDALNRCMVLWGARRSCAPRVLVIDVKSL